MSDGIVVGVSEAPASRRAADWAAQRAAETGERLVLYAVAAGHTEVLEHARSAAHTLASAEAERLGRGVSIETRVDVGNPTDLLIEASASASLLVIGSDHRGPGTHRGPHGIRIVAGAHSPVVVVPDLDLDGRTGVVVGVDGSETARIALDFAVAEAARRRETLTAVSAWLPVPLTAEDPMGLGLEDYADPYLTDLQDVTQTMLDRLLERVREQFPDVEIRTVVDVGDPATVIDGAASAARLAVVGTRGHGALARFLLGSVSERVLAEMTTVTAVVR